MNKENPKIKIDNACVYLIILTFESLNYLSIKEFKIFILFYNINPYFFLVI